MLVYLNRYEGVRIESLAGHDDLAELDALSDARFRVRIPEAEASFIVLDPDVVEDLGVLQQGTGPLP